MTLRRREKDKRKMKKFDRQLFDARYRQGNKISSSFNKIYVTGPGGSEGKKKKRYTSLRASRLWLGKDIPESASSYELLFPSLSSSAAFSSACSRPIGSRSVSLHSISEVPTLGGKGWDRFPGVVRATTAVTKTCFKKSRSHLGGSGDAKDMLHL